MAITISDMQLDDDATMEMASNYGEALGGRLRLGTDLAGINNITVNKVSRMIRDAMGGTAMIMGYKALMKSLCADFSSAYSLSGDDAIKKIQAAMFGGYESLKSLEANISDVMGNFALSSNISRDIAENLLESANGTLFRDHSEGLWLRHESNKLVVVNNNIYHVYEEKDRIKKIESLDYDGAKNLIIEKYVLQSRDFEIAVLMAKGLSNKQICKKLYLADIGGRVNKIYCIFGIKDAEKDRTKARFEFIEIFNKAVRTCNS